MFIVVVRNKGKGNDQKLAIEKGFPECIYILVKWQFINYVFYSKHRSFKVTKPL